MKNPFNVGPPSFDANAVNETTQRALASAGLDTTTGPMRDVTETIRRALGARRVAVAGPRFDSEAVVDVEARVLPAGEDGNSIPDRKPSINEAQQRQQPGCFEPHEFSNGAGKRAYKVNLPAMKSEAPRAMVVMLHGCTVDRSKVGSCALCVTAEASIWMQDAGAKQV